jgi:hypothetical protein
VHSVLFARKHLSIGSPACSTTIAIMIFLSVRKFHQDRAYSVYYMTKRAFAHRAYHLEGIQKGQGHEQRSLTLLQPLWCCGR